MNRHARDKLPLSKLNFIMGFKKTGSLFFFALANANACTFCNIKVGAKFLTIIIL
jgi:hypothetical protein